MMVRLLANVFPKCKVLQTELPQVFQKIFRDVSGLQVGDF